MSRVCLVAGHQVGDAYTRVQKILQKVLQKILQKCVGPSPAVQLFGNFGCFYSSDLQAKIISTKLIILNSSRKQILICNAHVNYLKLDR